jgi:hypothetical protein
MVSLCILCLGSLLIETCLAAEGKLYPGQEDLDIVISAPIHRAGYHVMPAGERAVPDHCLTFRVTVMECSEYSGTRGAIFRMNSNEKGGK